MNPEISRLGSSLLTTQHEMYSQLLTMGNCFGLLPTLSPKVINAQLEAFREDWKVYNPKKSDYKRFGLSLTSLDGGLTGVPDLTSLRDYNLHSKTKYGEMSFRKLTPVYEACPELNPLIEPLKPFLGRSHFLRFNAGGFFPYHRDSVSYVGDTFRIFVPLYEHSTRDFVFLLGQERLELEPGRPYFINTRMEHAVFSFEEKSTHLVLNVNLCVESLHAIYSLLHAY